ncbi:hypothetical protein C5F47_00355 [Nitrosopumilus cobalaminigenes]|uniref:Uncharacterized protein n=1 Tax=Nitrosopumilus cobalaminigenes TaxID=1470066 RepID=A0A7D5LYN1_9ARCH|nr:hypothetical protein C5F47_00355 [Nitrosopumilus cobalaminigenes]
MIMEMQIMLKNKFGMMVLGLELGHSFLVVIVVALIVMILVLTDIIMVELLIQTPTKFGFIVLIIL